MCLFQLQEMVNCLSEKFNIDQGLNSEHFRKGKFIKLVVASCNHVVWFMTTLKFMWKLQTVLKLQQ